MNKDTLIKLVPVGIIIVGTAILSVVFFKQVKISPRSNKKAGLQIESLDSEPLEININGQHRGNTPFIDDTLTPGRISLELKNAQGGYSTSLDLFENTRTTVLRHVSGSPLLSGGEIVWLEKIAGSNSRLNIIGAPEKAKIFIDGEEVGSIPYISDSLVAKSYDIKVVMPGYKEGLIRVSLREGYQLVLEVSLPIIPIPQGEIQHISDQETVEISILDLSSSNSYLTSFPSDWAKAVAVYIEENQISSLPTSLYFDYSGNFYDRDGLSINITSPAFLESLPANQQLLTIGYLGNTTTGKLSEVAEKELLNLKTQLGSSSLGKVKILPTGVGWLRVRSSPNLSGSEVAKINEGEEYAVIEEVSGWVKIKVSKEISGWVSTTYAKKL